MKKILKRAPLFIMIYVSIIVVFLLAQYIPVFGELYPDYANLSSKEESDDDFIDTIEHELNGDIEKDNTIEVANNEGDDSDDDESSVITITNIHENGTIFDLANGDTITTPADSIDPNKRVETNSLVEETIAEEQPYYIEQPVDLSYFDDAIFIGDSRTVGLCEYSGWNNADFLCDTGLSVYTVLKKQIKYNHNGTATVQDILTSRRYGKVYIMLGINECGTGTPDSFLEAYTELVDQIRRWQPDAIIVVQGIMRVGPQKSATHPSINNKNINARNEKLATLANNYNIYYLDMNEAVCDENGDLISSYSFDQVHLYAQYYTLWCDYLLQHGFVFNSNY